jgi:hypothetical protein
VTGTISGFKPPDFLLWGCMKALVYDDNQPPPDTVDEVRNRLFAAAKTIRMEMGNFDGVRQSLSRRTEACIRTNGGHFEHLLRL